MARTERAALGRLSRVGGSLLDVLQRYVEFRLASKDISTIRFGVSPGHEIVHAVRALSRPQEQPLQWGWLRAVRDDVPRESLELLRLVVGETGYAPDLFTSAASWDLTPEDEIERLRQAPLEPISVDLHKRAVRSAGIARAALERMAADPARIRVMIVRHVEALWEAALAPYWAQIERILHADIGSRVRRMTAEGLAGMAADLGEGVEWSADTGFDTVRVRMERHEEIVDCQGQGLVLVPSFFGRHCAVLTEPPAQPTLFYPALGVSEVWHRADSTDALAGLLGRAGPRCSSRSASRCRRRRPQERPGSRLPLHPTTLTPCAPPGSSRPGVPGGVCCTRARRSAMRSSTGSDAVDKRIRGRRGGYRPGTRSGPAPCSATYASGPCWAAWGSM
ncbi:DUF5937 family protein [Streptomyces sp. NBC_01422]|nr:DUF5937 family protein [Streptomyces sp. NBC_01422]